MASHVLFIVTIPCEEDKIPASADDVIEEKYDDVDIKKSSGEDANPDQVFTFYCLFELFQQQGT